MEYMDNYEKKYKEALEKATALYKAEEPMSGCNVLLETVFPELKESEDEKIRKALIKYFTEGREYLSLIPYNKEQCVAWLEKQGEEEIIYRPVAGTDIRIAAKQALEKIDIGKKVVLAFNGAYIPVNGKTVGEIDREYDAWLEKQGEQKPADKIEPKFKKE